MNSPFVTFEEAELNHLRDGMAKTFMEKMEWLEGAADFAEMIRANRFSRGEPVMDSNGGIFWNEEDYLGIPQEAKAVVTKAS